MEAAKYFNGWWLNGVFCFLQTMMRESCCSTKQASIALDTPLDLSTSKLEQWEQKRRQLEILRAIVVGIEHCVSMTSTLDFNRVKSWLYLCGKYIAIHEKHPSEKIVYTNVLLTRSFFKLDRKSRHWYWRLLSMDDISTAEQKSRSHRTQYSNFECAFPCASIQKSILEHAARCWFVSEFGAKKYSYTLWLKF